MRPRRHRARHRRAAVAALAAVTAVTLVAGCSGGGGAPDGDGGRASAPSSPAPTASPPRVPTPTPPPPATAPGPGPDPAATGPWSTAGWPAGLPAPVPVTCPAPTQRVRTAAELTRALSRARPGDSIAVADGTYRGRFTATAVGTAEAPVWLCGGPGAVLAGTGPTGKYVLHLQGVAYWRVVGLGLRDGRKGLMVDGSRDTVVQGLTVSSIGDEGIHLRAGSSDNLVIDNSVRDTGLRRAKYGEGIYVGTARSNWCDVTGCRPDHSDRNVVVGNRISATTAENVDIKEGTTGGVLAHNTLDGAGMTGDTDSWVDVKGNGWLVQANTGTTSLGSGFQTHRVARGWGDHNTFTDNTGAVDGPGYGVELRPVAANRLTCSNTFTGAARGRSNTPCR